MQAGYGGGFVKVRAELGVTSFGMQVIQMPPDYADYPEHDHADSRQEEVYVVLSGSGSMDIDGERVEMDPETLSGSGRTRSARSTRVLRGCGCRDRRLPRARPTRSPKARSSKRPEAAPDS